MDIRGGQARTSRGMTLVEVVLALAITSLFFCCTLSLIDLGIKRQSVLVEEASLKRQMNFIRLFVEDRFEQASRVSFEEVEGRLRKINFEGSEPISITKEKTATNALYKMTYKANTVANNIKEITYVTQGNWVYIQCTLAGRNNQLVTEDILLNMKYKQDERR